MSDNLPDDIPRAADGVAGVQPLRDQDTSIEPDPTLDPAQAEWDRTSGQAPDDFTENPVTATGDDPAHLPSDEDQVPRFDMPAEGLQPETQDLSPEIAELGESGQGDLAPEDY
jgi:hypothetical protein